MSRRWLCVLVATFPVHPSFAVLDLETVKNAFNSDSGVSLRVQDLAVLSAKNPASTTVWRKDLPLAFYAPPRDSLVDTAGVIFQLGGTEFLCGYPVDANTIVRVSADSGVRDSCGIIGPKYRMFDPGSWSGPCNFTAPENYANAYFYKPMVSLFDMSFWTLEYATCSFKTLPETLDAQKALLLSMMRQPENMTLIDSVGNASRPGSGITAFNEIIVAPFDAPAIGGIFWAHRGPFRPPEDRDSAACSIQSYLKKAAAPLPIFELAGVTLERPFVGCNAADLAPSLDCLSRGLGEWQRNLTMQGGRDADGVFRSIRAELFHSLRCGPPQQGHVSENGTEIIDILV